MGWAGYRLGQERPQQERDYSPLVESENVQKTLEWLNREEGSVRWVDEGLNIGKAPNLRLYKMARNQDVAALLNLEKRRSQSMVSPV